MKPSYKEILIIRKKGKLVYVYQSDFIIGVIFSKKESKTIELYMKQLVTKVEQVYNNVLKNWDGNIGIFNPVKDIFDDIISTELKLHFNFKFSNQNIPVKKIIFFNIF